MTPRPLLDGLRFLSASFALVACTDVSEQAPQPARCTPGGLSACSCSTGGAGESSCEADGRFGPCRCVDAIDDDAGSRQDGGRVSVDASGELEPEAGWPHGASDASTADAGGAPDEDSMEALRQLCIDTINGHRATLGLPPLARASASEESCSDEGAKLDHETGDPHGSAAAGALPCRSRGVAQNSCPDWRYGGSSGSRSATLVTCLQGMWDEGEPPQGVDQCIAEYFDGKPACFLAHGHYINMASPESQSVSCGFHDTGTVMWMNQDFR